MRNSVKMAIGAVLAGAGGLVIWWQMQPAPVLEPAEAPTVEAAAVPDGEPALEPAVAEAPDAAPEPEPAPAAAARFDVVRVDPDGQAVIAGQAAPGQTVEILLDGAVIGTAETNSAGEFVAVVEVAPSDEPRELTLRTAMADAPVDVVALAPTAEAGADGAATEAAAQAAAEAAAEVAAAIEVATAEVAAAEAVAADVAAAEVAAAIEAATAEVAAAEAAAAEIAADIAAAEAAAAEAAAEAAAAEIAADIAAAEAAVAEAAAIEAAAAEVAATEAAAEAAAAEIAAEIAAAEASAAEASAVEQAAAEAAAAEAAAAELAAAEVAAAAKVAAAEAAAAEAAAAEVAAEAAADAAAADIAADIAAAEVAAAEAAAETAAAEIAADIAAAEVAAAEAAAAEQAAAEAAVAEVAASSVEPEVSRFALSAPVIILPQEGAEQAPILVKPGPEGVTLLQPAMTEPTAGLVLDRITYSGQGDLLAAGRGQPGTRVRIYANAIFVEEIRCDEDGKWQVRIASDIAMTTQLLRFDEVDAEGTVLSRLETPFEYSALATTLELRERKIVVQKGDYLWKFAEQYYGEGIRYSIIFSANAALIRDPDLIYPGQIFTIPELVDSQ